jgi:hypothetical protein
MDYDHDAHQALLQRSMHRVHIGTPPEPDPLDAWVTAFWWALSAVLVIVICVAAWAF